jgi:hypothetical protein
MKKANYLLVLLWLTVVNGYSQQKKTIADTASYPDSIIVKTVPFDVDKKIASESYELDSLYHYQFFKDASLKNKLMSSSKEINDYVKALMGHLASTSNSPVDSIYSYKFHDSSLADQLNKYISIVHQLNVNNSVKKVAVDKIERTYRLYKSKKIPVKSNSNNMEFLKLQLYRIIWTEIYLMENAEYYPI